LLHGQSAAAVDDCGRAAQLGNDRAGAYDDRATAELALGDMNAALADTDRAINAFTGKVGPDAQPNGVHGFGIALLDEAKGWILVESGRAGEGVAMFETAQRLLPSSAVSLRARLVADISTARTD
jgi:tetratricopeptide (TPR) repeat protein